MSHLPLASPMYGDGKEDGIITICSPPSTDNIKNEAEVDIDEDIETTKDYYHNNNDDGTLIKRSHRVASVSPLDSLPAEMRIEILLNMPDTQTLNSIIRASPMMLNQYLLDRPRILSACLEREMDGYFVDAYANFKSHASQLGSPRTNSMVEDFVGSYQHWMSPKSRLDAKSIRPWIVQSMAYYHNNIARPLARRYGFWALENLQREGIAASAGGFLATPRRAKRVNDGGGVVMSRSEEARILRAIYRCETYYNLFGYNGGVRHGGFMPYKVDDMFFNLFNPWEAEAIACIDTFARQQYSDLFQQVRAALHPRHPRFRVQLTRQLQYEAVFESLQEYLDPQDRKPLERHYLYLPKGSHNLDERGQDYMDGTVARGLKVLLRLLTVDDHQTLASKMARRLRKASGEEAPMPETMNSFHQMERRRSPSTSFPNAMDMAEQRQEAMAFLGDSTQVDGPPLAWVLLWGGKYANIHGALVPEPLKRMGYVMWDESRWGCPGARAFIAKQWAKKRQNAQYIEEHCGWSPLDAEARQ